MVMMKKSVSLFLIIMVIFGTEAAEIREVLSGQTYDGISKTPNGDYLVTTGGQGSVIRFNSEGNSSVIYDEGAYTLYAYQDSAQNVYISDPANQVIIKDYFNGPVAEIESSLSGVAEPAAMIQSSFDNLYVSTLNGGRIAEISNLGPFIGNVLSAGMVSNARSLAFDNEQNLYIANAETAEVFRLKNDGNLELWATLPIDSGDMRIGHLLYQDQHIYVTGFSDNRLYAIDMGGVVKIVAGPGAQGDAEQFIFDGPLGLAHGEQPFELYVSNYRGQNIQQVLLDAPSIMPQQITESSGLSGLWFDPNLNGEGYNILISEQGMLVIYYGFDAMGERLWLISDIYSEPLFLNQPIQMTLSQTSGGLFTMPADPSDSLSKWGSLELIFDGCTTGMFTLNGLDGQKVSLVRQLLKIDNTTCQ